MEDRAILRTVPLTLALAGGALLIGYALSSGLTRPYVIGLLLAVGGMLGIGLATTRTLTTLRRLLVCSIAPALVLALGIGVPLNALHRPAEGEVRWRASVSAAGAVAVGDHVAVATADGLQLRRIKDGRLTGTVTVPDDLRLSQVYDAAGRLLIVREGAARLYGLDGTALWDHSVPATAPLAATKSAVLLQNCADGRDMCTVASYDRSGTTTWTRKTPRSTPVLGLRGSFSTDEDPPRAHALPRAATVATGARSVDVIRPGKEVEELASLDDVDLAGATSWYFFGMTRRQDGTWTIRKDSIDQFNRIPGGSSSLWDESQIGSLLGAKPSDFTHLAFMNNILWAYGDDLSVAIDLGEGTDSRDDPYVSSGGKAWQLPGTPTRSGDSFESASWWNESDGWAYHADSAAASAVTGTDLVVVTSGITTPALFAPVPRENRRPRGTTDDPTASLNLTTDYRVTVLRRDRSTIAEQRYDSSVDILAVLPHAVLLETGDGIELLGGSGNS